MKKKILIIDNTAHHAYGQMHLMTSFQKLDFVIEVIIPNDNNYFNKISQLGIICHNIIIDGKGINPFKDFKLVVNLKQLFYKIKPDIIYSFTIKPNLYSAIAARKLNIPIIASVTGLGHVFLKNNVLTKIVILLYRFSFKHIKCAFFQNVDNKKIMEQLNIIPKNIISLALPGDGVDVNKFRYVGIAAVTNITFMFAGRLLWDKGVGELIEAIQIVKQLYPKTKLKVIGNFFLDNPSGIPENKVFEWQKQNILEYLGMVDNVFEFMSNADCVVLPSYHEGLPRVLMEACSMGKPIITVDSVGCRDVVENCVTGYVAEARNSKSLANAMIKFIELPYEDKVKMGLNGRKKMEVEFNQKIVTEKYIEITYKLLKVGSSK